MAKKVQCELCPNGCVLEEGGRSKCRTRINKDGSLYSLVYGKPCAAHIDPIEKKPFFHFLPGTTAFSIATAGCVLSCKFCQNWQISQEVRKIPIPMTCHLIRPCAGQSRINAGL
jgi:pyruvate formate lyase activating enzyme